MAHQPRYAIVGGGIVGLALAAFLGRTASITIFEKRADYAARQRYLQIQDLFEYLEVDSLKDSVRRFVQYLPFELQLLFDPKTDTLVGRAQRTSEIQHAFQQTFSDNVQLITNQEITKANYQQILYGFDFVFDCSGYHSIFRHLINEKPESLLQECINEHCLIVSFKLKVTNNKTECNRECKFAKNLRNSHTVIPHINDIIDDNNHQHVTCLVKLSEEDYNQLQNNRGITLETLQKHSSSIHDSITRFTDAYGDKLVRNSTEIVAIPLYYYMIEPPILDNRILLVGDSAMGSPYFQSASNGIIEALAVNYYFQTLEEKYEAVQSYLAFYTRLCDFVAGRTRDYATIRAEDLTCLKTLMQRYSKTFEPAYRDAAILLSDGLLNFSLLPQSK